MPAPPTPAPAATTEMPAPPGPPPAPPEPPVADEGGTPSLKWILPVAVGAAFAVGVVGALVATGGDDEPDTGVSVSGTASVSTTAPIPSTTRPTTSTTRPTTSTTARRPTPTTRPAPTASGSEVATASLSSLLPSSSDLGTGWSTSSRSQSQTSDGAFPISCDGRSSSDDVTIRDQESVSFVFGSRALFIAVADLAPGDGDELLDAVAEAIETCEERQAAPSREVLLRPIVAGPDLGGPSVGGRSQVGTGGRDDTQFVLAEIAPDRVLYVLHYDVDGPARSDAALAYANRVLALI